MPLWKDNIDPNNKKRRTGRESKTKSAWWNSGHPLSNDDTHISTWNLGLGGRERRGMASENSRPWGSSIFAQSTVTDRAKEAKRRGKAKAKGKKFKEKRETGQGMKIATKKNKSWWS